MVRRILRISLAVLLLIALCGTTLCALLTDSFRDWNPFCWEWGRGPFNGHNYDENGICTRCGAVKLDDVGEDNPKDPEDPAEPEDVASSSVVANVVEEHGIKLLSTPMEASEAVSPSEAANSYVLTATVTPSDADNKAVDWTIRWKNAESEWAQDKSVEDYGIVTPEGDGSLKATVLILKDFGEQIEVVVTSREKPTAQAICLFDYVQRITGITFNMPDIDLADSSFNLTYEFETSDYTIEAELNSSAWRIELTYDFKYAVARSVSNGSILLYFMASGLTYNADSNCYSVVGGAPTTSASNMSGNLLSTSYDLATPKAPYSFFVIWKNTAPFSADEVYSAFRAAIASVEGAHATFDFTYTATYDGKTYSTGTKTIDVRFDGSSLHIPVEDVELDNGHVIV